ncbi:MAG: wax ester/triacylglycerol synthase family O-acyltransferase [Solirubrobacterales bacterium]
MPATRLSPLDDSFLATESATAHMHVGWAAVFDPPSRGPRPDFHQLRRHIESRLHLTPRYRQKISPAPLGLDAPSWVDDDRFEIERHVVRSQSDDLDHLAAECMSRPLERDRPLWEICIADHLSDGRIGLVGKVHHCMVDGVAAVELALLLLDPTPDPPRQGTDDWRPEPEPSRIARLRTSAREKATSQLELAGKASGLLLSPRRMRRVPGQAGGMVGTLSRALRPARPVPALNEPISARRRLARVERPLAELQRIKRHFRATVNDVYLAIAAGAMRRLLLDRNQRPRPLKTMVPVDVRENGKPEKLGNQISFLFVDLPCDEPDPERRLRRLQTALGRSKRGRDPGAANFALNLLGYAPRRLQRLASRIVASPLMFNLTVSNIPGPSEPMFMLGCELKAAYPVVPIADRHALSIGMTTIQDRACFGLYADRDALGDVHRVADAVERSSDELLALT